jgi:putative FmdB family regulatory protein
MPIFEYACSRCRRIYSFLVRSPSREKKHLCPACAAGDLKRVYSPFALVRSEESRLGRLEDPSFLSGLDEKDPRSLARMMRKMAAETGEPMDTEMTEMCDRLEAGEDPEEIEKSLEGPESAAGGYTRDSTLRE